ncbi:hypothetical protein TRVL_09799 [Trypanosoma vivax]|nr:hypothetical protein TRVL_09799 [Trypanosoma vivax]
MTRAHKTDRYTHIAFYSACSQHSPIRRAGSHFTLCFQVASFSLVEQVEPRRLRYSADGLIFCLFCYPAIMQSARPPISNSPKGPPNMSELAVDHFPITSPTQMQ